MKTWSLAVAGLGKVGQAFLELLPAHPQLKLVGVSDSTGVRIDQNGLTPQEVLATKKAGAYLASGNLLDCQPEVYLDVTPTSFDEPSLEHEVLRALRAGIHVVTAAKGPLVMDFSKLVAHSDLKNRRFPKLRFGAAIGAALPSYNVLRREFAGARIQKIEGILNITSQRILGDMASGLSFEQALQRAHATGSLERNWSLDVDGWDAAAKLLILCNASGLTEKTLADVEITGIRNLALERNAPHALLAVADFLGPKPTLRVSPQILPAQHPLARIKSNEQGLVITSDLHGELTMFGQSRGPTGTAASLLRDVLEVTSSQ